jgi:phage terminase small subunit
MRGVGVGVSKKQTKKYREIKQDLLAQLEKKFISRKHYEDLVEDYMAFWVIKEQLQEDIDERGVVVTYNNGGGQSGSKKNDSVSEKIKVTVQMSKILDDLGIKPTQIKDDTAISDVKDKDEDIGEL